MRKGLVGALSGLVLAGGVGTVVVLQRDTTPAPVPVVEPTPYPTRTPLFSAAGSEVVPTRAGLATALAAVLRDGALGRRVSLSVVDVTTRAVLLDVDGDRDVTPASTAKLATAVAALTVLEPDHFLTTRVVRGRQGEVVLVGGGDASLSRSDLADLARQLKTSGTAISRVLVDDTLFAGQAMGPGWKPGYVQHGNVAPVSSLSVDEGRTSDRDGSPRVADPALEAGRQLAKLVGARSVVRGAAAAGAEELAHVDSAPVADLVEQMLTHSDNDLAEALGRQVALATRLPASFPGEAAAIAAVLHGLGVEVHLRDASGLSPLDRVQPAALTALLARAAGDQRYAPVLSGLPVAGFDGTLSDRFRTGASRTAAGQVRAKTGTLDGVSALAGYVLTREGRLLAFDLTADGVPLGATVSAERALDRAAAVLAACGCR
jgi:D-alanyl-D-alanine carboxypeptidase/D-alanyl-D-alanine-endopeptidase (penicillin-binding protein 4)